MEASEILVLILGIFLAIFLALGITLFVYAIQVIRHVRNVTEKAEVAAEQMSKASVMFTKAAGPAAVGRMLVKMYNSYKKKEED